QVGATGVPFVLAGQLVGDRPPDGVLLRGVLDVLDRVPPAVTAADLGDGRPAGPVLGVGEPGVVLGQLEGGRPVGVRAPHAAIVLPAGEVFNRYRRSPDASPRRGLLCGWIFAQTVT